MTAGACEVLVAGAGVAGTLAAVAAARAGARTLLVERESWTGGTGYAGMLRHICGLYLNGEEFPGETINAGLTREVVALLQEAAPQRTVQKIGQLYVLPYACDDLQCVLNRLCSAEQNLRLLTGRTVTAVGTDRGEVRGVTVCGPGGTQEEFTPAAAVDCTGSGDLAALAGADFELSDREVRQLAGFTVRVSGLAGADEMLAIKVPYYCARFVRENLLPASLRFTVFSLGEEAGAGFLKLSLDAEDGAEREARALSQARALLDQLARVLPAFRDAVIAQTSLRVQDREGRRITGEYRLTEEEVLSARKFPDGVVKNAWPIELWDRSKGTIYHYPPRGDYYEIPFRCLRVKEIANLLTAGRCISVTHEALGSMRVMGACMALGEKSGRAAAYYAANGKFPDPAKDPS